MTDKRSDSTSDGPEEVADGLLGSVNPLDAEGKLELRQQVRIQVHQDSPGEEEESPESA
jgi:hypothetical protein